MEELEIYSEKRRDRIERIKEPPDGIDKTVQKETYSTSQFNNKLIIAGLLGMFISLFLAALWQRAHLQTIEETLKSVPEIKASLSEFDSHIKSTDANYHHSMASISEELKNLERSLTQIQSSITGLEKLFDKQKNALGNAEKSISEVKAKLILNDSLIKEERKSDETEEGDNQ